jgi:NitT/TauT family transport system substrate-binding protein
VLLALACAAPAPAPAKPAQSGAASPAAVPAKPAASAPAPAAAATTAPAPAPQALQTVSVGVLNIQTDAPILIADQKGYFREAGIQLEPTVFQSASQMVAPLGAGQLDVGGGALSAGLYNAVTRGVNVRVVADRGRDNQAAVLVRKELYDSGQVRSIADLRGLRFQLAAECIAPEVGAATTLSRGGLTLQDVEVVALAHPDTPSAIANASLDVVSPPEPFATLIEQAGTGVALHRYRDEPQPYRQLSVMLYGPAFAERREGANNFMYAYLRGIRDYYDAFFGSQANREEAIQLLIERTALKQRELYDRITSPLIDPNGELNQASMVAEQEYYVRRGCQQQMVDLAQVVDLSFINAAVARLGPYQPR